MRKIINAVLWALLYFVGVFAGECLGFIHPFFWLYFGFFAAIFAAWPYVKLNQKHPVFGMALLAAGIWLGIYLILGEGHKTFFIGGIVLAVIAEALRLCGGYGSKKSICLSYCALALIPFAKTIIILTKPDFVLQNTVEEMGQTYADQMFAMPNSWLFWVMVAATLAVAYILSSIFCRKKN